MPRGPGGPRDRGFDRPGRPPYRGREDRPAFGRPVREAQVRSVEGADVLGEDEELVAGRRPVEEAFVAHRPAKRLLVVPNRRAALERVVLHATNLRIPIVEVEGGTLTSLAGFDGHQGVALVVEPRRFATLDDVLARSISRGEPPFVLVMDSLEDPQNVGTLLRSAEAVGAHGVVYPTHRQAPLSPAAVKASAGAIEHLLLAPVDDLAGALADLHVRGLRIVGAESDAPLLARQADLRGPLAIVVGSEGQGLGPAVRRRCDLVVRIPMRGAVGSLNAAVAGSILLFEVLAQRDPEGKLGPPPIEPLPAPRATQAEDPAATAAGARSARSADAEIVEGDAGAAERTAEADTGPAADAGAHVDVAEEVASVPGSADAEVAAELISVPGSADAGSRVEAEPEDADSGPADAAEVVAPPGIAGEAETPSETKLSDPEPAAQPEKPARRARRRSPPAGGESVVAEPGADDDLLPGGPPATPPATARRPRRRADPA